MTENKNTLTPEENAPHESPVSAATRPASELMQFFEFAHLPEHLQDVSKHFYDLAELMDEGLPHNTEKSTALRKLLEAKDCAVRAVIYKKGKL